MSEDQCAQMLHSIRLAGASQGEPEISGVLVQLLVQWVERGRVQEVHRTTGDNVLQPLCRLSLYQMERWGGAVAQEPWGNH